jgi:hypothetical protein
MCWIGVLVQPSVLILISSRQFLESEMANEGADPADDALPIYGIQSGLPSTILLVSDDATSEQQAFAEQFQAKWWRWEATTRSLSTKEVWSRDRPGPA